MKRSGSILILSVLIVLLSFNFASAASFEITSTYPEEGYNKVEPKNVMIKLFLSETTSSDESKAANKDKFTLKGPDDKDVKFEVLYDSKDTSKICLVLDEDLVSASKYKLSISPDLISDTGNTLGSIKELNFETRNTSSDGTVNMVLMGLMIAVMIFFTTRDAKKQAAAQDDNPEDANIPSNPYKYAKEKGITVQQATKEIAEMREKAAKKNASKASSANRQKNSTGADTPKKSAQKMQKQVPKKVVKKVKTKRRVHFDR